WGSEGDRVTSDDEPPGGTSDDGEPAAPPAGFGRRAGVIAVLVVAVLGGAVAAVAARGGGSCPPDGAAVEVRGRVVTEAELDRRVELLSVLYGIRAPGEDDPERAQAFRGDAAKAVAVAIIVEQEVDERELQAAEKAARDALDRFVAERYPEGGRAKFIEALGNEGVSEAEVLDEFRRLLETRRLFDAVTAGVEAPTDEKVAAAYEKRKDELAQPERRHLRHLVVKTEEEAGAALASIQGGEAFPAVAMAVSLDASTKAEGGELGIVAAEELDPAFAAPAFSAAQGQAFGPVQTDLGWHVGLVEEITPGRPVSLDEVRDALRQQLLGEEKLALWRDHLGEAIEEADVCYSERFRPADPDAPPPDVTPNLRPPG
ncbi:MAG TPA: peptidyl-prolyl cis-trans isomerase, partial [Acidimicrobiia bacterium]|nr:peptidyl-prolyl cis-trans isomerase [Acidimicrobiia bacterium]